MGTPHAYLLHNQNYNKILESDWLSTGPICGRPILLITRMITDRIE